MTDAPARPRPWPVARAVLITLAIGIGLADGCPLPGQKARARLPAALADTYDGLDRARATFLAPFRIVGDLAFVRQRWNLFMGVSRERNRMWIEGRTAEGGEWKLLYRAQDDEHDALADQLAYRRIRGAWTPRAAGPRGGYSSFVTWVATALMARDPSLTEIRVQMEKVDVGDRGGWTPRGEFQYPQTRLARSRRPL